MIQLTKIFHFEMAHAIFGYQGSCANIHGHSYELHVGVVANQTQQDFIPSPGFLIDFKEIKSIVNETIIKLFDHKLLLSRHYLEHDPTLNHRKNLVLLDFEPTAENLLIFIQKELILKLPLDFKLNKLTLYETKDSYAEWTV